MANMTAMFTGASKAFGRALLPALVLATVGMLIAASSSFGQAAVEQYIPDVNPTGHHNGGGSGRQWRRQLGFLHRRAVDRVWGRHRHRQRQRRTGSGSTGKKAAAAAGVAGLSNLSSGGGGGSSGGGSAPGTSR